MNMKNQYSYCTAEGGFGKAQIVEGKLQQSKKVNHFRKVNKTVRQQSATRNRAMSKDALNIKSEISLPDIIPPKTNKPVNLDLTAEGEKRKREQSR